MMSMLIFLSLIAIMVYVGSGASHTDVQHHSKVMSREIGQRFNRGLEHNDTARRKKAAELEPSAGPTGKPTLSLDVPTVEPTLFVDSPTVEPTLFEDHPSAEPTSVPPPLNPTADSVGYYYFTNSFNSDCSDPVVNFGSPVGTCLSSDTNATSYMIRIVDDNWNTASIDSFSDPYCQELSNSVPFTDDVVKCRVTDWPIVTDPSNKGGKVYSQMHITTSSTPPRNGPIGGALFENFEGDTNCNANSFTSFVSYAAHVCLTERSKKGNKPAFSFECSSDATTVRMNVDLDSKPDCTGSILPFPLPDTCELDISGDDDDDDDYGTEYKLDSQLKPSAAFPADSLESSQRVTCQPSQKSFSFKVTKQVINGFSKTAYDSDTTLYSLTLKQAVAATMQDVDVGGISDMVVTVSAARASADAARATLRTLVARALQTSSSVDLAYTVSGMSQYTSSQLAAQLQTALTSGEFNSVLHLLASQNGATELRNATSSSVETDINDDDSDDPVLSTGAIVGIVVGAVVFVAIIVGIVVCLMRRKDVSTKDSGTIALVNLG